MELIYLPLGLIPPALSGWLLLDLLQHKKRVLHPVEQIIAGLVSGLMLSMIIVFSMHTGLGLPLNLALFGGVQLVLAGILGIARYMLPRGVYAYSPVVGSPVGRNLKILFGIMGAWIAIKLLATSITFLLLTPTYLDDTLDNWNLRGKLYFYDQALTLALPSEDPVTSVFGISSYPPAVPLMKTWLATLARTWTDPLVNSIHIIWYVSALTLLYFALRRFLTNTWSITGTLLIGSMPLYLMHGTNPYADTFVSVHVFLAVSMMLHILREQDPVSRMSFVRIGAFAAGLMPFTKNEGLMLYLPPLLFILCIGMFMLNRSGKMSIKDVFTTVTWYAVSIAVLALPWLTFKWAHGLTFGNAQSVSGLNISWQQGVVQAIGVNTYMEGNWLFLFPLLIMLLVWRWRSAFGKYLPLTAYFLIVYLGQLLIFLFTELAAEARMQTGLARGVVQQLPVIILVTTVLLADAAPALGDAVKELAGKFKKVSN